MAVSKIKKCGVEDLEMGKFEKLSKGSHGNSGFGSMGRKDGGQSRGHALMFGTGFGRGVGSAFPGSHSIN